MNIHEAIEKIENQKSILNGWEELTRNNALDDALAIVRKIDEPEKPTVPQFVADWYKEHKDDFNYSLYDLCFKYSERKLNIDLHKWFRDDDNEPFETLVMMHKFGYVVEGEEENEQKRNN